MNVQKDRLFKLVSEIVGPEFGAKIIDCMEREGFMFARRTFLEDDSNDSENPCTQDDRRHRGQYG